MTLERCRGLGRSALTPSAALELSWPTTLIATTVENVVWPTFTTKLVVIRFNLLFFIMFSFYLNVLCRWIYLELLLQLLESSSWHGFCFLNVDLLSFLLRSTYLASDFAIIILEITVPFGLWFDRLHASVKLYIYVLVYFLLYSVGLVSLLFR